MIPFFLSCPFEWDFIEIQREREREREREFVHSEHRNLAYKCLGLPSDTQSRNVCRQTLKAGVSAVRHSKQECRTLKYFDELWNRAEDSSYERNQSVASIEHLLSHEIPV